MRRQQLPNPSDTSDSETATEEDLSESEAESPNEKYKELTIQDYFNLEGLFVK